MSALFVFTCLKAFALLVGSYDFRDAENTDGITESVIKMEFTV